jgi:hypothetical protein
MPPYRTITSNEEPTFPEICPFAKTAILNPEYLPD